MWNVALRVLHASLRTLWPVAAARSGATQLLADEALAATMTA
jgi:hypothetical protein